ncbi:uncharacterized protein LOC111461748 isoform X1 [Cucurbita moschata]|uniref:Uncharacterized protein LOC111461748 isoform X1 n=1 Tax=Cucurbita moschata TaxID=3662 RepID=A0A6J1HBH0_CUCMO|nr:uncharacterized protein LOC111461748 isoform X1 [Cucurbita moschata]
MAAAAALSFSPFHLDDAASTRMLKDFLQESNGNGESKTASFVKRISFPSLKLRRILPRSLSRRLSGMRERDERETGGDFVVKVKDIIRWRSFRDLVDETAEMAAPPLDFADSPDRYTAAATTTTTTTATNSNSSSWCESDFTAEDLPSPSWKGCSDDDETGKVYFSCVGEDLSETPVTNSENDKKVNLLSRDNKGDNKGEQSARRLLERIDETISLSRSYKLMELFQQERPYYRESEDDEERDKNNSTGKAKEDGNELFRREFSYQQASDNEEERDNNNGKISTTGAEEDENELFRREFSCYRDSKHDGERDESNGNDFGWILSQKGKENLWREMEREGKWGVFGNEEREELGLEIEGGIFGCLVDEIMLDIFPLSV